MRHFPNFGRAFTKAVDAGESARLESLISELERDVRDAFLQFLRDTTSEDMVSAVADRLERGDVQGALDLINVHIEAMGGTFPRIFIDAATAETSALIGQVRPLQPTVGVTFDPSYPAAADLMRANKLEFVTRFTDTQAAATRAALAEALDTGAGIQDTARAFRESIGLTEDQVRAVNSYERLLRANSRLALDRVLRDRRFDPTVERAVQTGEPLSEDQINLMVDRYRARALASRAETLARTETIKTMSQAQDAAMEQTMAAAKIEPGRVEQTWNTIIDGRERFTHEILDGQVRPFGVPFQSVSGALLRYPGDPSAPAAEIINCRCHRTFRILSLQEMEDRKAA